MSDVPSFGNSSSGSGGGAVTGASGSFVDGAITTLGAEGDAASTNSAATSTAMAFIKGSIKVLADVWDSVNHRFNVAVQNGNANGVTTGVNSQPVVTATDDANFAALRSLILETQSGLAGFVITEDAIRNLTIAGKAYSVSTQKITGVAGAGGFQFYNPASGTKNILILGVSIGNAANVTFEMRKISTDQSLLTGWTNQALTPSNSGASATASTATVGYSSTAVTGTFTGNYLKAFTLNSNSEGQMLENGMCIWLPSGAGSLAGICLTWAETAVAFNINVFYLEF